MLSRSDRLLAESQLKVVQTPRVLDSPEVPVEGVLVLTGLGISSFFRVGRPSINEVSAYRIVLRYGLLFRVANGGGKRL